MREADHLHACTMGRLDAVGAVLDHQTSRWWDVCSLGGKEEEVGEGLAALNMVTGGDDVIGEKLDEVRCRDSEVHPLR